MKKKRRNYFVMFLFLAALILVMVQRVNQEIETDNLEQKNKETAVTSGQSIISSNTNSIVQEETLETVEPLVAGDVINQTVLEIMGIDNLFYSTEISPEIKTRISGISYEENNNISLSELRYVRVLYYGFDGETHIGELIVNQKIELDMLEIMKELYEHQYPIEKMVLIDEYNGEDEQSMADNNTSSFNYRSINGSSKLSKHSLGLAIDINPRYNPCIRGNGDSLTVEPVNGSAYADRAQEFPHKITEQDLCYQLFLEHGFIWGGSWNSLKDYQHFEKGVS